MLSKTRAVVVGIFLILSVATPSVFFGQNAVLTWKDHVRLAEKAISDGLQADAAAHFEAAFFQKPKNLTLAARAAQAFAASATTEKRRNFSKNCSPTRANFQQRGVIMPSFCSKMGNLTTLFPNFYCI